MDKSINKTQKRNVIEVAVGIIANQSGELLVAKRPEHWLGGGFWEFPGGKIESNEDTEAALKRELLEEIGIVVEACSPLIKLSYNYPERTVILHAWNVLSFTGNATGLEGQEICWRDPESLNYLNMLPANRAIVVATQLPDIYLITPNCLDKTFFLNELERNLKKHAIKMMALRSKNLNKTEYINLAKEVLALCKRKDVRLLLKHDDLTVIKEIDADGVHLCSNQLNSFNQRPLPKEKWVSASCHNLEQITKAEAIGVDFITVSPVQDSIYQTPPLGWEEFDRLVSKANIPVFALGGLSPDDIPKARKHGAHGIAAIRSLWG